MFIPDKNGVLNVLIPPEQGRYVVYGWQQSYFTRKLEAALRFYGAPFELRRIGEEIEQEIRHRSGSHQIPVLHTPENWMIADTTPLLMMLDGRFPDRRLFPFGAAGVLVHIIEEYFDEWIARTSVHWRWAYEENHKPLALDLAVGDEEKALGIIGWGSRVCRATGVSSPLQQRAAEEEYHRILAAAEAQLGKTAYLLGNRPTAADCIVLGGLRAHFNHDPAPRRAIHSAYPRTIAWCEGLADSWQGEDGSIPFPEITHFAAFILKEMAQTYKPFALANRKALREQQKAFVIPIYGEEVSYLARPYVEKARQMIRHRINYTSNAEDRDQVWAWLKSYNLNELYLQT